MKNRKRAFTLAETMIVLIVLGIIAAISIPGLIRHHVESSNRTKIKKSLAAYELAVNKMVIENNIKGDSDLQTFGTTNSCEKTRPYFKSTQNGADNCTFKTSDGVWWNISDITHPIISVDKTAIDVTKLSTLRETAKDLSDNRIYSFIGHFDNSNGALRVDDLTYESGDNKLALSKVYGFINGNKRNQDLSGSGSAGSSAPVSGNSTTNCDLSCTKAKFSQFKNTACQNPSGGGFSCYNCKSCYVKDGSYYYIYDEKGQKVSWARNCTGDTIETCKEGNFTTYDEKGRIIQDLHFYSGFYGYITENANIYQHSIIRQMGYVDNADGSYKKYDYYCGSQFNNHEECTQHGGNGYYDYIEEYNASKQRTKYKSYCDENEICTSCNAYNGGSCAEVRCENYYYSYDPSTVAGKTCYYK